MEQGRFAAQFGYDNGRCFPGKQFQVSEEPNGTILLVCLTTQTRMTFQCMHEFVTFCECFGLCGQNIKKIMSGEATVGQVNKSYETPKPTEPKKDIIQQATDIILEAIKRNEEKKNEEL